MTTRQFQANRRDELRRAREAANDFAHVCREGRADVLEIAASQLDDLVGAWCMAMKMVARLDHVSPEVQHAFETAWVWRKHVPLKVGNRPVCSAGLRVLFPGNYSGPPLKLYRGTTEGERRRHLYGFSWTTDLSWARVFAERHSKFVGEGGIAQLVGGAIILQTIAPADAILLVRVPEDYYDEGEVVVDPFQLKKVTVVERVNSRP